MKKNEKFSTIKIIISVVVSLLFVFVGLFFANNLFTTVTATNMNDIKMKFRILPCIVKIPEGTTVIADEAFWNCNIIKGAIIPKSVTNIESAAFESCPNLVSITLPSSIQTISQYAFVHSDKLNEIHYDGSLEQWCKKSWRPDSVFSHEYTLYIGENKMTDVIIPEGIRYVADGSFYYCSSLSSLTANKNVQEIGYRAFYGCSNLQSLSLEKGLTDIHKESFAECRSLKSVTLPNGLRFIGAEAFRGCYDLQSIKIPNSVMWVGPDVLEDCDNLTSAVYNKNLFIRLPVSYSGTYSIPDGITEIVGGAFANCVNMKEVIIPPSVQRIRSNAFEYCCGLVKVDVSRVGKLDIEAFLGCHNLIVYVSDALYQANRSFEYYGYGWRREKQNDLIAWLGCHDVKPISEYY